MNCREFKEIADSYLSDELAVETNHEIFRHLENCVECRGELAMRRDIRLRLRQSVKNASEFQMQTMAANRISARLKEDALKENSRFGLRIFAPVLASLLIAVTIGFSLFYSHSANVETSKNYLFELSQKAIGDHENCALKKLEKWKANKGKVEFEKVAFVKPLQNEETEVLEAHDCIFEGKPFTHYILQRGEKTVSVMKTASESDLLNSKSNSDSIICEKSDGLQMASFQAGTDVIFVISDLNESENLSLARTLSNSLTNQI